MAVGFVNGAVPTSPYKDRLVERAGVTLTTPQPHCNGNSGRQAILCDGMRRSMASIICRRVLQAIVVPASYVQRLGVIGVEGAELAEDADAVLAALGDVVRGDLAVFAA